MAEDGRFQRVWDAISAQAGAVGAAVGLEVVCRAAVTYLRVGHPGVTGAAVTVPGGQAPGAQTLAAYGPFARSGEELQVGIGEGPSLEGLDRAGAVLIADLDAPEVQTRWPVFAPTAAAAGVGSMYVVPMGVGAARFGVFVVYLDRVDVAAPGAVAAEVLADVLAFAGIALDLLLDVAAGIVRTGEDDPAALGWFFDDHPAIHQATGMIAGRLGIDMATAFLRIRAAAFGEGRTLSEVAGQVVSRTRSFEAD